MKLHKRIEARIQGTKYDSSPEFRILQAVNTIYYCEKGGSEMVAHGIVVGVEHSPELTMKIGWWYKVLVYSVHVFSEEHDKMFKKLKIDFDTLDEIEVIDVYFKDIYFDRKRIDVTKLLSRLIVYRRRQLKDYGMLK